MPRPSRILLLATLAVGTAVFGGTLAALSLSGPLDPRAAVSGILAAAALTVALAGLLWVRRRSGRPAAGGRRKNPRPGTPPAADGANPITVIPLGAGQAVVVFDQPAAGPKPGTGPAVPGSAGRDAALAVDAIWDAVSKAADVVDDASR